MRAHTSRSRSADGAYLSAQDEHALTEMSFASVGLSWTPDKFQAHISAIPSLKWATSITLHHTAIPSLAQRPDGLSPQHIRNLRHFYSNVNRWSAGPHLFVDDRRIHGMTPLTQRGVHAVSFNRNSIGIEVLGNYDLEDPTSGRGLECWKNAAFVTAALMQRFGIRTFNFHRDDPRTRKSCPGARVKREWFTNLLNSSIL